METYELAETAQRGGPAVAFTDAGAVEVEGVSGATQLYLAHRPR